MLVYGVTPDLQQEFDFSNTHLELARVLEACDKHGAVAVPSARAGLRFIFQKIEFMVVLKK